MRAAALVVALGAGTAWAQALPFSPEATEACLVAAADRPGRDVCVGRSADACISANFCSVNAISGVV